MDIGYIVERASRTAREHGFVGNQPRSLPEHVALLHEEVSELFGCWRDGMEPDGFYYKLPHNPTSRDEYDDDGNHGKLVGIPSELADLVIRACQMSGEYGIDLVRALREKMAYNETRPFMHGRVH